MQRRLYIDEAHTALDIFRFAVFLESKRKGLLKNVKDGISRPLGSREIQITKVCTVLPDTLYIEVNMNYIQNKHVDIIHSYFTI